MSTRLLLVFSLFLSLFWACNSPSSDVAGRSLAANRKTPKPKLQNGDIVFQVSQSSQCKAIQLATGSKYAHCGIIYEDQGSYFVYEAVQPVGLAPFEDWVKRGKDNHYVVKRLKNADKILTNRVLDKMKAEGEKFKNKDYDLVFNWSDDKIYCSELVWKIYQRATGLEIGQLQQLGDFDLRSEEVKAKLKERYGNNIPLSETVVSPAAIYESPLLETIEE